MGREDCHNKTVINEWIKDINVEIWTMQKVIDFEKYGSDPTYFTNMIYTSRLLDPLKIFIEYLYIGKHMY